MTTRLFVNLPVEYFAEVHRVLHQTRLHVQPAVHRRNRHLHGRQRRLRDAATHEKFQQFTPKSICDATKSSEVLLCLAVDSREAVDEMVRNALAAGGTTYNEPQDHGFMYGHAFQDLDGHIWELIHMRSMP